MKRIITMVCLLAFAAGMVRAADEGPATWPDKIKLKGDVRYRHEYIDDDSKDVDRHRQRIRARIGAYADVNNEVKAGIRLTSGGVDPVSGNQTLDDAFSSKGIQLDLAYFNWEPEALGGIELTGGKMKKPWITMHELIWDGDLNPEGLAVNYELEGEMAELLVHGGGFWINEISDSNNDIMLYSGQAAVKLKPTENVSVLVGGSYFYYDNIDEGTTAVVDNLDTFGNEPIEILEGAPVDPANPEVVEIQFANGFKNYEGFLQVKFDAGVPVKVFADYVVNDDAADQDTGYQFGVSVGKAKDPGTFALSYNYRDIEANAVLGAFTDSDFRGGGTDGSGHEIGAKYQLAKNWQLAATYFINQKEPDGADVDYQRGQLDLVAKF